MDGVGCDAWEGMLEMQEGVGRRVGTTLVGVSVVELFRVADGALLGVRVALPARKSLI